MARIGRISADKFNENLCRSVLSVSSACHFSLAEEDMLHEETTSAVINAFYKVYNTLGYGFLEKVYENALVIELQKRGLTTKQQMPIHVYYEGKVVGEYFADLVVNDVVIVELKAAEEITKAHENQLVNYLKATNLEVGLILNFGPQPKFKRKIFTNERKPALKIA
jgi:GxxExxY protein